MSALTDRLVLVLNATTVEKWDRYFDAEGPL
jgi:hypothetical protein